MKTKPETNEEFVLNLDTHFLQQSIATLEFAQLKGLFLKVGQIIQFFKAIRRKTDSTRG